MSNMMSKVKNILGFGEYEDEFVEDQVEERFEDEVVLDDDYTENQGPDILGPKGGKVVNIHTNASAKVLIIKPTSYEESMEICDALKNRRIVVINTSSLENKVARRLLDFLSGSSYALQGDFQEIEKGVYILSPSNVEVTNELKSEISSKAALFNWTK